MPNEWVFEQVVLCEVKIDWQSMSLIHQRSFTVRIEDDFKLASNSDTQETTSTWYLAISISTVLQLQSQLQYYSILQYYSVCTHTQKYLSTSSSSCIFV